MLTASISNATDYEALSCCCTTNCPSGWLAVCKLSCNPRPTARCGAHTVQLAGPDNANPCWLKFTASRTSCKTPTEQSTAAGTNGTAQFQNWLSVTFEGFRLVFTAISDIVTDQQSYARQAVHDKCRQAGSEYPGVCQQHWQYLPGIRLVVEPHTSLQHLCSLGDSMHPPPHTHTHRSRAACPTGLKALVWSCMHSFYAV